MSYAVKEIFYTLQGEGIQAGRPAVFCRFSGCNLWSGREPDRATARCRFCDTDFVGTDGTEGGRYASAAALAAAVAAAWPATAAGPTAAGPAAAGPAAAGPVAVNRPFVVCTGGEPLLQLDPPLVAALHDYGFTVAIETNGTLPVPAGVDWVCVSPKAGTDLVVQAGDELKLVHPQPGADPAAYADLDFDYFLLQPLDDPGRDANLRAAVAYCLVHPQWRLSLQTHKIIGVR